MFYYMLLAPLLFLILLWYWKQFYKYWKDHGVRGPEPFMVVGNLGATFLQRKSAGEVLADIYKEYKGSPYVGIFKATSPALLIRDPNLIKNVTVKDFDHFHDNDIEVDEKVDLLMGKHPVALKGDHWKAVRSLLTPCFSSGKIKAMLPLILDVGNNMVKYIEEELEHVKNGLEAKTLSAKFTTDNVASCAFGLEGNSFKDPNSEFRKIASQILAPDFWSTLQFTVGNMFPSVAHLLNIQMIPKDVADRTYALVKKTLKYRRENNVVRNDFLNILNELKSTVKDMEITDLDITAHAAGFIGDGIETSSIVLGFALYDLATNLDVQRKLREEIVHAINANNGEITYELVQDLPYLDAVLSETLRIHPPVMQLPKECTKDYTYHCKDDPDFDEMSVKIEKGVKVIIPVYGLHMDPNYFEKPEKFIPDRFFKENKDKVRPYTYLPFGGGPRACLGQRFGLLQVKVGLMLIVKNFEMRLNKKTQLPLKFDPSFLMMNVSSGLWLNFSKVKSN